MVTGVRVDIAGKSNGFLRLRRENRGQLWELCRRRQPQDRGAVTCFSGKRISWELPWTTRAPANEATPINSTPGYYGSPACVSWAR
ncbi:hypothetical protein NIIDMKKI_37770 [Mycobacterium kansasii]|uniref:Uncharacterized protein n=1 Tax=Mycobacterium kansasii TaxID=1768 RepID=A0A7G1IBW7_MYCKA|nr:hypothetical protein NIIDMKKI_37770 [Mycobacterium kansasii]